MKIERQINIQGDYHENNISHIIVNSTDYNDLVRDIQELQEDIQNATTDEIKLKKSGKLSEKQQQLESLKDSIYRLYETFNKISLNTERLQQAKIFFDAGKFREADALLNPREIALEVEQLHAARRKKEQELSKIDIDLINKSNEYLIKAKIWSILYSEPNWYDETKKYFEEALKAVQTVEVLFEYAKFLYKHNQFPDSIRLYEEVLKIHRKLAKENPNEHLPDIAMILNNLANIHFYTNEYPKALDEYKEALEIRQKLAEKNPKAYLTNVATTLNNLAGLHYYTNDYPEALEEYEEALKIRRELAEENSENLPDVANTLNNLAILHKHINEYPKALEEYKEALKIRRKLAEENPKVYLSKMATTLNNLAGLHKNITEYSKASDEYEEALGVYRVLAKENPNAHFPYMAGILSNLAGLHKNINEYSKAVEEYEESLEIYKMLAKEDPKAYLQYVGRILKSLSVFYQDCFPNKKISLKYAKEAVEILEKCNNTPFVRKQLDRVKAVIEKWR